MASLSGNTVELPGDNVTSGGGWVNFGKRHTGGGGLRRQVLRLLLRQRVFVAFTSTAAGASAAGAGAAGAGQPAIRVSL